MTMQIPPLVPRLNEAPGALDWLRQPAAPATTPLGGNPAHLVRRGGAFLIDVLLLVAVASVVSILVGERIVEVVMIDGELFSRAGATLNQGQARGVLLAWFLYLMATEAAFGATLGKRVFGISVVQHNWARITLRGAVLRRLTHLVPIVVFAGAGLSISVAQAAVYVVGAVFTATSEDRQRLGDRLAGTMVVRSSSRSEKAS
jgi:uncharacterized RDD family membrane protein YckC